MNEEQKKIAEQVLIVVLVGLILILFIYSLRINSDYNALVMKYNELEQNCWCLFR